MDKFKLSFLLTLSLIMCALTGCGTHVHTFSEKWSSDTNNHWHDATCGHKNEKSELGQHNYGNDAICDTCGYVKPNNGERKVTKETWTSIMSGASPFGLISNGTINYIISSSDAVLANVSLQIDENKIKEIDNKEFTTRYYHAQNNDCYCYSESNVKNKYLKSTIIFEHTIPGFISYLMKCFDPEAFSFDSSTKSYLSNNSVYIYSQSLDKVSISFIDDKLNKFCVTTKDRYIEVTFNYQQVTVTLPQIVEQVNIWTSYGTLYTTILDNILNEAGERVSSSISLTEIYHYSQGSYERAKNQMLSAIADCTYPDVATGRLDDIVEYSANDIIEPLDEHISEYDLKHNKDLLSDYYPEYMQGLDELDFDKQNNKVLSAIPHSASTELMGYNGVFVDYCASLPQYADKHLDVVPATWQEWETKGPYYREILSSLCANSSKAGYCVYGRQDVEGNASDFNVVKYCGTRDDDGRKLLLDFSNVNVENTRVISWDTSDDMFITLIKQWGAEYTRITDSEKQNDINYRRGDVVFYSSTNKPVVIDCLNYFNKLNKQGIFGVPKEFNASYSSTAFENCQVMFLLCHSGGLSYRTTKWENRFRVAPLPYNANRGNLGKLVHSQIGNLFLTDNAYKHYDNAFEMMAELSTGDLQAEWCLKTGYYPVSKSATNSQKYQEFLNEGTEDAIVKYAADCGCTIEEAKEQAYLVPTRVTYREGSQINNNVYMNDSEHWTKFVVDAAFIGSSVVREVVKHIFEKVFTTTSVDDFDSYDRILKEAVNDNYIKQLQQYIRVVK